VVLLPKYLLAWDLDGGPAPTDRAKAVNDIRTTLLQGLGGAALLIGAYFTWRQVQIAREGQLTERFTTAVGQLSNRSVDVRLGGIYALERIAIDSERDRQTTYEVLCAYVRQHAPVQLPDPRPHPTTAVVVPMAWPPSASLPGRQASARRFGSGPPTSKPP